MVNPFIYKQSTLSDGMYSPCSHGCNPQYSSASYQLSNSESDQSGVYGYQEPGKDYSAP